MAVSPWSFPAQGCQKLDERWRNEAGIFAAHADIRHINDRIVLGCRIECVGLARAIIGKYDQSGSQLAYIQLIVVGTNLFDRKQHQVMTSHLTISTVCSPREIYVL